MDTIFTNSENSKTSKLNVSILKLTNKVNTKLSNLSIYCTWKNMKKLIQ